MTYRKEDPDCVFYNWNILKRKIYEIKNKLILPLMAVWSIVSTEYRNGFEDHREAHCTPDCDQQENDMICTY